MSQTRPPPDSRHKLVEAAIAEFGRKGLEGTSTRDIARRAGVNIAGIAYHFGGKDQLYLACAEHIAQTVLRGFRPPDEGDPPLPPAAELKRILARVGRFMLATPETADFARFVLREQMDPTPAFELLYATVMAPMHQRLCALWGTATGADPGSERAKLKVFALISQILFYRMARAGALKRLGWTEIDNAEIDAIVKVAGESVDALIEAEGRVSEK
jgi:AcrR family transcriptional regulator